MRSERAGMRRSNKCVWCRWISHAARPSCVVEGNEADTVAESPAGIDASTRAVFTPPSPCVRRLSCVPSQSQCRSCSSRSSASVSAGNGAAYVRHGLARVTVRPGGIGAVLLRKSKVRWSSILSSVGLQPADGVACVRLHGTSVNCGTAQSPDVCPTPTTALNSQCTRVCPLKVRL